MPEIGSNGKQHNQNTTSTRTPDDKTSIIRNPASRIAHSVDRRSHFIARDGNDQKGDVKPTILLLWSFRPRSPILSTSIASILFTSIARILFTSIARLHIHVQLSQRRDTLCPGMSTVTAQHGTFQIWHYEFNTARDFFLADPHLKTLDKSLSTTLSNLFHYFNGIHEPRS